MSAVISPPYLRWFTRALRWALRGLGVAILITVLAWALLHAWIVPRIDQWRPEITQWVSAQLGVPVEIARIHATSNGWRPEFELEQVRLLKPDGEPALVLPRVRAALSPISAWQLSFEALRLDAPQLEVWRNREGRLWVAGFEVSAQGASSSSDNAWNWLLRQRHVLIQQGQVRWIDEQAGTDALRISALDVHLSNRRHRHRLTLAATPPEDWGQRFSWQADLKTPVWRGGSDVRHLSGQVFAEFPHLNAAALRRHVSAGIDLQAASGALRAWFDVKNGQWQQATADVDVKRIQARFAKDLTPLDVRDVAGRVTWKARPHGFALTGENLRFAAVDGEQWQGAKVHLTTDENADASVVTQLQAEQVNLAALRQVLTALPLDADLRAALRAHPFSGRVQNLDAGWTREANNALRYQAKGSVRKLLVAASAGENGHAGVPGVRGADVDFDLHEGGGQAQLRMANGSLSFPGVFEEPEIPVDALSAQVNWTVSGADIALTVNKLQLRNADAQGQFEARWQTKPQARLAEGESRFPGELTLTGQLDRANGARVHRYLPLAVGNEARHYVKDAVVAGQARNVTVAVRGDLHHFPFAGSKDGLFRIVAPVSQVQLQYVPRYLQHAQDPAWPPLEQLAGSLEFEGNAMHVRNASGRVRGFPGIHFASIEAEIAQLDHAEVKVQARGAAEANEGLRFVRQSPLAQWLHGALDSTQASRSIELKFGLVLPISNIESSSVKGEVGLQGNDITLRDDVPLLRGAQGRVVFDAHGFSLRDAQANSLGGSVALKGGTEAVAGNATRTVIEASGRATAQGLRDEGMLAAAAPLLAQASGETAYHVRYAVQDGQTQVQVASDLQGMALGLPAPLTKPADAAWPMRFSIDPAKAGHDTMAVQIGEVVAARYQRQHREGQVWVASGQLALGKAAGQRTDGTGVGNAGVSLRADVDSLDVDAWRRVFDGVPAAQAITAPTAPTAQAMASAPSAAPAMASSTPALPAASAPAVATANLSAEASRYLPQSYDVRAKRLHIEGKTLTDVRVRGTHQGQEWAAELSSDRMAGSIRYRDDGAGRLHARLSKLHVPEDDVADDPALMTHPPSHLPGMDLLVEDLRLGDKRLGQLSFKAANRGGTGGSQTWQIEQLSLAGAGGTLLASGAWQAADQRGLRHTELQFQLKLDDAGGLLARLGMPGVLRKGQGEIGGALSWQGSPLQPDPASMAGRVQVDVTQGQFLKADPGLAKLLGVLSLQSLPRRLSLDFRDVFSEGFAYDFIRGDALLKDGVATTNNLQMKGANAAVLLDGKADLAQATQDLRVVVAPRIDAGGAALVATVINPAIGIGAFLAQLVLSKQINEAATRTFHVTGSWAEPEVVRVRDAPPQMPAASASTAN